MRLTTKLILVSAVLVLATACKKEIDVVTVSVDKVYSWMAIKQLWGN